MTEEQIAKIIRKAERKPPGSPFGRSRVRYRFLEAKQQKLARRIVRRYLEACNNIQMDGGSHLGAVCREAVEMAYLNEEPFDLRIERGEKRTYYQYERPDDSFS